MTSERVLLCLCADVRAHQFRRAALEDSGYEVQTAASGADALQMIRFRRFAALLVEDLPNGDARVFLGKVREIARELPVVLLSDTRSKGGAEAVVARGDLAALRATLEALTGQPAAA